jgi:hypothetical protein
MGEKIPQNFDSTVAFMQHVEPLIDQLIRAATEHGIAITCLATYRRTIEDNGEGGFNESASTTVRAVNIPMHAYTLMATSATADALSDHAEALHTQEGAEALFSNCVMCCQKTVQEVIAGAEFLPGEFKSNETIN